MTDAGLNATAHIGVDTSKAVVDVKKLDATVDRLGGSFRKTAAELALLRKEYNAAAGDTIKQAFDRDKAFALRNAQLSDQATATQRFNAYRQASNARVAKAELDDIRAVARAVAAERAERDKASALRNAQLAKDAAATKKFNDYRRSSNARVAAAELADIRAVTAANTAERAARDKVFQATSKAAVSYDASEINRLNKSYADHARYIDEARVAGVRYGDQIPRDLSNTRYALVGAAQAWGALTLATLGSVTAVEMVGAKYESAFSGVERTSGAVGAQLGQLRDDLIALTTAMPTSFVDVAAIGTLGGQLGIDASEIAGFTESVAQFSATTDASIDATATGFGRLAQLTGAGRDAFNNIGSAVYQVGINSVATETQVMSVAQEIATAGNLAGFSTEEIIGLAGALASLGVQPERARGNILRIFSELNAATQAGGEDLRKFADVAGQSSAEFASSWQNTPERAFSSLLSGLNRSAEAGQNLDQVIHSLGITAVRDVQTLQQLADNTDVYARAQGDAAAAYEDGTALADGYSIVADDLVSKLKVLANTVLAIADAASNNAALKVFVDVLQDAAGALLGLIQTPVGGAISAIALSFATLVGIFAAFKAVSALASASTIALMTAQQGLARNAGFTSLGVRGLVIEMGRLSGVLNTATASQVRFNAAQAAGKGQLGSMAAAANLTRSSVASLGASVLGFAKFGAVLAAAAGAFYVVTQGVTAVQRALEPASETAERFLGSFQGLSEAIDSDTKNLDESAIVYQEITASVETATKVVPGWVTQLEVAAGAQVDLDRVTQQTTKSTVDQTIKIGEATRAWLADAMVNSPQFQQLWRDNGAAIQAAGGDVQEFFEATLSGSGTEYLSGLTQQLVKDVDLLGAASYEAGQGFTNEYTVGMINAQNAIDDLRPVVEGFDETLAVNAEKARLVTGEYGNLEAGAEDGADAFTEYGKGVASATSALQQHVDALFRDADLMAAQQDALYGLGSSLAENGTSFDIFTANGRANMEALQAVISAAVVSAAGDAGALAANLQGIANSLGAFGVNLAQQVPQLASLIGKVPAKALGAVATSADQAGSALRQGFSSGARDAAKSSGAAAKQIKTLTDYVSDLSSVFKTAFDVRFGLEQSTDDVASAFDSLVQRSEDAAKRTNDAFQSLRDAEQNVRDLKQEILDLDATVRGLQADRTILEYQLGVASEYGDTLRVEEILADLAKTNADLAGEENKRVSTINDIAKANMEQASASQEVFAAQEDQIASLDGTTEGSAEQRAAVLALVRAYQGQVTALANTGMSQDRLRAKTAELKVQFEQQLAQLGYNNEAIRRYSAAFDDMSAAISRIPRNITVSADLSPADRAIAEFLARNTGGRGASQTIQGSVSMGVDDGQLAKYTRLVSLTARMNNLLRASMDPNMPSTGKSSLESEIYRIQQLIGSGGYKSGGYTGRGGANQPAGVVHAGEYVFPKTMVNQSTGLPFADAFGRVVQGFQGGGYVPQPSRVKMPTVMVVELSPTDRALLAAAGGTTVTLDGSVIASSVNSRNTNSSRRGSR